MPRSRALMLAAVLPWAAACAAGGAPSAPAALAGASDAEWQALVRPRPAARAGAPRIALGAISLAEERPWGMVDPAVPAAVGLQELIAAELLRREDVQFVERRRFAEAAERERRGLPRPDGAPPVGTSAGAQWLVTGTMSPLLGDSAYLEMRLVDPATSDLRAAWRVRVPRGGDPTTLARRVTGSLLATLDSLGTLPDWTDPVPDAALRSWRPSGVPLPAVESFFRGVAAEDAFNWDTARRAYQRARMLGGPEF